LAKAAGEGHVPAVGGTRLVPPPDAVARDYLLLGLRLDQHIPGLVDGYFGPAELKAEVDMEQLRSPARLRDDAAALRDRLPSAVTEPDRRAWLEAQLVRPSRAADRVGSCRGARGCRADRGARRATCRVGRDPGQRGHRPSR
jgi:hypothetical protein